MESFKQQFTEKAKQLLSEWSAKYQVDTPAFYILDDTQIDPFFSMAIYLRPGIKESNITGPAILFSESYVSEVYYGAVRTGDFDSAWNCLTWSLAHEFGHHVAHRRRAIEIGFLELTAPTREYIRRGEISASLIAYNLTKKTRAEKNYEFYRLTGLTNMSFWRKRKTQWQTVHFRELWGVTYDFDSIWRGKLSRIEKIHKNLFNRSTLKS